MDASFVSEDDSQAITISGIDEVSEFGEEDGLEYEPDWDDDDILDQPINLKRLCPDYFEMGAPDSEDSRFEYLKMDNDILTNVRGSSFWKYLSKVIPGHYQWGLKVPLDELISFTKEIDEPILLLPKTQHVLSQTAFRCILQVCGDTEGTDEEKKKSLQKVYKLGLEKTQRIRDEIILLVIKQIRKNEKSISTSNAWSLLAMVLSVFEPSKPLAFPLMNWLMNVIDHHKNPAYQSWARYILCRVYNLYKMKDTRVFTPIYLESQYVKYMKKIRFNVFMMNGTFMQVWIESYTTFRELKHLVLAKLNHQTRHHYRYGFMEQVDKRTSYDERFMEDDHNVLDVVASWELIAKKYKDDFKRARIFFVIKVNPPYLEDRILVTKIQFANFAYNLALGKFQITNDDIIKLVALNLYMDFGEYQESFGYGWMKTKYHYYIPQSKRTEDSEEYWIKDLIEEWKSHDTGYKRMTMMRRYMKHVHEWNVFGGHFFPGKFRNSSLKDIQGVPQNVIMVVKTTGLLLLEEDTKEPVMEYDFMELTNWGCSKDLFVFSLGDIHALNKFYFIANQAPMMAWILNSHANLMANKDPETISLIKKFKFEWNKRKRKASVFSKLA